MQTLKRCLAVLLVAGGIGPAGAYETYEGVYDIGNLVSADYFRQNLTYPNGDATRRWGVKKPNPSVVVTAEKTLLLKGEKARAGGGADICYSTADAFDVKFRYRTTGRDARANVGFGHPGHWCSGRRDLKLEPSAEWRTFEATVKRPEKPAGKIDFSFRAGAGDSTLEVCDLEIRERARKATDAIRLTLGGVPVRAIRWMRGDLNSTWYDRKAARMLSYSLRAAGGGLVPVEEEPVREAIPGEDGVVYIGRAAERTGLIGTDALAGILPGGWAMAEKGGRLAIAGAHPCGAAFGVKAFLRRLGIDYYCYDDFTKPSSWASTDFASAQNPAVPYRWFTFQIDYHNELLGYLPAETHSYWKEGGYPTMSYHNGAWIMVPTDELLERGLTNWFAMKRDGTRRTDCGRNVTYCMSNPDVMREYVKRASEFVRINPQMNMFAFAHGDGGDVQCYCPECRKLLDVSKTDLGLDWWNRFTTEMRKEFPDIRIRFNAYAEYDTPPKKTGFADGIFVEYCAYMPYQWPAMSWWDCPGNDEGKRALRNWFRLRPGQVMIMSYPSMLDMGARHAAPTFYFNAALFREVAENRALAMEYCGMNLPYGGGGAPGGPFSPLGNDVLCQILVDPKTDVERAVDRHISHYYGPAAAAMRDYFNVLQNEPMRRKWVQNCEQRLRGFFADRPFAEKCFEATDRALAAAPAGSVYATRVSVERRQLLQSWLMDVNRAFGNVPKEDSERYARRLGEFCRRCRDLHISYIGVEGEGVVKWFRDNHLYKLDKKHCWHWHDDPAVQALIDDPVKALSDAMPIVQEKSPDGWRIPTKGMLGGEINRNGTHCLSRPSSGYGTLRARLRLDAAPKGVAQLRVNAYQHEHPDSTYARIEVNGRVIFNGLVPWVKVHGSLETFQIPDGVLVAGENEIAIYNTTPDKEVDGLCGPAFAAARCYWWGWFTVRDIELALPPPAPVETSWSDIAIPDWADRKIAAAERAYRAWKGNDETVVVPLMTDLHDWDPDFVRPVSWNAHKSHILLAREAARRFGADAMVDLGDLGLDFAQHVGADGKRKTGYSNEAEHKRRIATEAALYSGLAVPSFHCVGNHDFGGWGKAAFRAKTPWYFGWALNGPNRAKGFDVKLGPNADYGYWDVPGKKTRLVFLDSCELNGASDGVPGFLV